MQTKIYTQELKAPINSLEEKFGGADNLIRAAFAHSFFICPDTVRKKTVWFPGFARTGKCYGKKKRGDFGVWENRRKVKLELNGHAQTAWKKYTGRENLLDEKGAGK